MQFLLFNWYCNENENYGIIIARCAIQGAKHLAPLKRRLYL